MTRYTVLFFSLILLFSGCAPDRTAEIETLQKENAMLRSIVDPPPASMDKLFPPNSPAPVWHIKMFEMAGSFTSVALKASEGNIEGAKTYFAKFKSQYRELPTLVPEWAGYLPMEPLDRFEAVLNGGDPGKIMPAFEELGQTCHNCHIVNMPKVQARYDWPEFASIVIAGPASGSDVSFVDVMRNVEATFTGIGVELQEGNRDKAIGYYEGFRGALGQLKETCATCHDSERMYYVSGDVMKLVDRLGASLKKIPPDVKSVIALSQEIGFQSCTKCHMVHVPAAFAQARMSAHK